MSLRSICAALLLAAGTSWAAEPAEVLKRFDAAQSSVHSLSAEFVQTTTNRLLAQPIVARGKFYMTRPASLRLDYVAPERMNVVIDGDQYTGYFPNRNKVEKRDIKRWSHYIFRFFGLQATEELAKIYDLRVEPPAAAGEGPVVVLDPKKKRLKKRIDELRFWLDAKTYLPVKVRYQKENGDAQVIEFHDLRVNPDLAANFYRVDVPSGVTVTDGFSMPAFKPTGDPAH
ncbi:MAG TPA: outer membrane lipoprotein carrier protein LolA [Candidatus Polarisedimenticolaceae bacterium]|nr:outer membrane lipoprotein carrier protein LolA [Candidatus Polarisedimenticolaceae bacterium]